MAIMKIKELRCSVGFSQSELAEKMGVVRNAVTNWESEISLPKAKDIPVLAKVLGCEINDLFAQDDEVCGEGMAVKADQQRGDSGDVRGWRYSPAREKTAQVGGREEVKSGEHGLTEETDRNDTARDC